MTVPASAMTARASGTSSNRVTTSNSSHHSYSNGKDTNTHTHTYTKRGKSSTKSTLGRLLKVVGVGGVASSISSSISSSSSSNHGRDKDKDSTRDNSNSYSNSKDSRKIKNKLSSYGTSTSPSPSPSPSNTTNNGTTTDVSSRAADSPVKLPPRSSNRSRRQQVVQQFLLQRHQPTITTTTTTNSRSKQLQPAAPQRLHQQQQQSELDESLSNLSTTSETASICSLDNTDAFTLDDASTHAVPLLAVNVHATAGPDLANLDLDLDESYTSHASASSSSTTIDDSQHSQQQPHKRRVSFAVHLETCIMIPSSNAYDILETPEVDKPRPSTKPSPNPHHHHHHGCNPLNEAFILQQGDVSSNSENDHDNDTTVDNDSVSHNIQQQPLPSEDPLQNHRSSNSHSRDTTSKATRQQQQQQQQRQAQKIQQQCQQLYYEQERERVRQYYNANRELLLLNQPPPASIVWATEEELHQLRILKKIVVRTRKSQHRKRSRARKRRTEIRFILGTEALRAAQARHQRIISQYKMAAPTATEHRRRRCIKSVLARAAVAVVQVQQRQVFLAEVRWRGGVVVVTSKELESSGGNSTDVPRMTSKDSNPTVRRMVLLHQTCTVAKDRLHRLELVVPEVTTIVRPMLLRYLEDDDNDDDTTCSDSDDEEDLDFDGEDEDSPFYLDTDDPSFRRLEWAVLSFLAAAASNNQDFLATSNVVLVPSPVVPFDDGDDGIEVEV